MTLIVESKATNKSKLPQGPNHYSLLEQLNFIFKPLSTLESQRNRYGDIYYSPSFASFPPFIIITNAEGVEALFTADPKIFDIASSNAAFQPLLGGQSILQLDGNLHEKRRKLLMPSFHGQRLQSYGKIITDITQSIIERWQKNDIFSMRKISQDITLNVILQAVFGISTENKYGELSQQMSRYLDLFNSPIYPNSKQFKPERFLNRQFSPYEFIPFGGSNRRCIGYALALYEMKLVLATILKQVNLKLVNSRPILPVRRGFTMSPQGGVKMQVR